jgi:DNA-binding CsgD family transcriptional regulator
MRCGIGPKVIRVRRVQMQTSLRLLTHNNLQRLPDALGTLYTPVRPQQLAEHFAGVLRSLIPGEFYGVSIVLRSKRIPNQGHRDTILYPMPAQWERLAETFASQYQKFPLRSIRESGDLHTALALSDIASRKKVESLDLYHDYYRILGVTDDLSVNFGHLGHRVCLAVLRGRRGFSDQDRTILEVLRPHMERAYRYARLLESLRATGRRDNEPSEVSGNVENHRDPAHSLRALGLSEREAEVLYWVAAGKSSPVIGTILGIRHDTVRAHLKKIFAKLGVENRLSAALRALQVLRSASVPE